MIYDTTCYYNENAFFSNFLNSIDEMFNEYDNEILYESQYLLEEEIEKKKSGLIEKCKEKIEILASKVYDTVLRLITNLNAKIKDKLSNKLINNKAQNIISDREAKEIIADVFKKYPYYNIEDIISQNDSNLAPDVRVWHQRDRFARYISNKDNDPSKIFNKYKYSNSIQIDPDQVFYRLYRSKNGNMRSNDDLISIYTIKNNMIRGVQLARKQMNANAEEVIKLTIKRATCIFQMYLANVKFEVQACKLALDKVKKQTI